MVGYSSRRRLLASITPLCKIARTSLKFFVPQNFVTTKKPNARPPVGWRSSFAFFASM